MVRFQMPRRILTNFCRLFNPNEYSGIFNLWDPRPGVNEAVRIAFRLSKAAWRKYWCAGERRRMRRFQTNRKPLVERLYRAKRIVIVCAANMIRSPFTAGFMALSLQGKTIISAGVKVKPYRQAHPKLVSKGNSLGFDFCAHTPVPLTPEMVAWADLIFAMEVEHLFLMRNRFSGVRRKTFLLSCLAPDVPIEIPDPGGKDDPVFETCFAHITRIVESVSRTLLAGEVCERNSG